MTCLKRGENRCRPVVRCCKRAQVCPCVTVQHTTQWRPSIEITIKKNLRGSFTPICWVQRKKHCALPLQKRRQKSSRRGKSGSNLVAHKYNHTNTNTHKHTNMHTNTQTHRHTPTPTHTDTCTHRHLHTHSSHTPTHTHTHAYTQMRSYFDRAPFGGNCFSVGIQKFLSTSHFGGGSLLKILGAFASDKFSPGVPNLGTPDSCV